VAWWSDPGKLGKRVFQFLLKRLQGQPPLATRAVQFVGSQPRASSLSSTGERLLQAPVVHTDISGGLEPIPVTFPFSSLSS
jgi:hypothetical protein